MIDHWADLTQLRADGRRVLRWIVRQGVVMCCEPTEQERTRDILLPAFRALEAFCRPSSQGGNDIDTPSRRCYAILQTMGKEGHDEKRVST